MDIKKALADKKPAIDAAIERAVPRHLDAKSAERILGKPRYAYDLPVAEKAVNHLVWDLLDRGGKRWRPALLLWAAEAVGGKKAAEMALEFAAIPEVLHNGTLVIDDLEDDSINRRGKPCLHRLYGTDLAVNAGNAMYFLPLQVLAGKKMDEKMKNRAYEVVVQEMVNLSYGQGFDIYWHHGHGKPSESEYLQMCAFKTGTLSRMSAKLGGILGGGSDKQVDALGQFAEGLGIAFQIQDDVLNLVLPEGAWGKDAGEDITEGPRSLVVIHALSKLAAREKQELLDILNSHTREKDSIARAISLIQKTGALEYANQKAESLVDAAWKKLAPQLKDGEAKDALWALAHYAIRRQQ
ncbi:MAG: polyprenyl synthetase family protein [Candidatus Micrarchaeota archaeon]|nr:polyprenyl synthetase family protein [Candidatus Micrarchaeota archaeon]